MTLDDVLEVLGALAGLQVHVDGGWCVEALVGRALRPHADLDLAVARSDLEALRQRLTDRGWDECPGDAEGIVLFDRGRLRVDAHAYEYGPGGTVIWGVAYPPGSLSGSGTLGGRRVDCVAAEWMFRFKTGYPPRPRDLEDVAALAERFGFTVPASHRA